MLRRIVFLALVIALAPGCTTVKGWFGDHGAKKALKPAELTDIASPIGVRELWSVNLGGGEGRSWLRQHPTLDGGRVYAVDTGGDLMALDASSGKKLWSVEAIAAVKTGSKLKFWHRETAEIGLTSSPGVGSGMVVVGGRNGEVIAFDAATGAKRWSVKVTSEVLSAPLVLPDRIIVRSNDGRVFGLDPADGARKWVFDRGLPTLSVRGNSSPIGANGLSFIGYDDGTLVALRAEDGQKVWEQAIAEPDGRTELERMADVDGEIVLDGDTLYAASYHDKVMAVSAANGQPVWTHDVGGYSGVVLAGDKLLLTDKQGNIWALDRATGNSDWKQNLLERRQLTTPVVQGAYGVVGDLEGYLHWFKLETGDVVGRQRVEHAALRGSPQVSSDGVLYAVSNEGKLTAYRLGN